MMMKLRLPFFRVLTLTVGFLQDFLRWRELLREARHGSDSGAGPANVSGATLTGVKGLGEGDVRTGERGGDDGDSNG